VSRALINAASGDRSSGIGSAWRLPLLQMALAALGLCFLFASDLRDMVTIWLTASTYNHCALIPFLSGWLAWQRRDELVHLTPQPSLAGLLLLGAGAALWLLGDAGEVAVARQTALVLMLQSLVPLFLGLTLSRALLFPVAYLLFCVPIGEELLPVLQTLTAKMSMAMLDMVGIPAHIEGIFITTPNGYYKVAEACAGVKFLVAMVAYGALVANMCFRAWPRRIAFMAACIVIPILANGVRAFATMYVGYLTTADTASSFDHVFYGWFFFAMVMALVMAMAWPFFDRKLTDPWLTQPIAGDARPARKASQIILPAILIALAPVGWSHASAAIGRVPMPSPIGLPDVPGWSPVQPKGFVPWVPRYVGADHLVIGHYEDRKGHIVDLAIVLYASQAEGREIIGYGQGAAGLDADRWVWSSAGPMIDTARTEYVTAPGAVRRLAATWYVAGGRVTGSPVRVKLDTMVSRLVGRDQAVAAVIVSAQDREGLPAEAAVRAFTQSLGSPEKIAAQAIAEARR
jgi:exosortase A